MPRYLKRNLFAVSAAILLLMFLTSCSQTAEPGPRVWIDSPAGSSHLQPGSTVEIISHAYAVDGLAEVVLSINGEAYQRSVPDPEGAEFAEIKQQWSPGEEGTYRLEVLAYDRKGHISSPAVIKLVVSSETAALDPTLIPTVTAPPSVDITVTPVTEHPQEDSQPVCPPLAEASTNANCRAGPGEIYDLLTVLKQGDESVVVGRSEDSSWWVIERPDAAGNCWIWEGLVTLSSDTCRVLIFDAPPSPEPVDSDPPPVPSPMVPADGLEVDCKASQNLVWLPVEDTSGIEGYHLQLQKEISSGSWQSENSWGPITGKQKQVPVDCGLRYRWRIRAEDGAGNFSSWSSYSLFTVNLD